MKRIKIASYTSIAHFSRLLVSLFIIKQIAVQHGPEGLGFLSNFMTLVTISGTLAGGGISTGIIKYISEYSHSYFRQLQFAGNAFIYTSLVAIITVVLGFIYIEKLSYNIFLSPNYCLYIGLFFVAQLIISFNNFFYGILNGFKENILYSIVLISGNFLALFISYFSIKYHYFLGSTIAILCPVSLPAIPILIIFSRKLFRRKVFLFSFNAFKEDCLKLSKFSLMTVTSIVCFPIVEIILRNTLINYLGLEYAGYWQAITKLSSAYLSFYLLFLTAYFVPILSSTEERAKIFSEVRKMIIFIASIFLFMVFLFFYLKDAVITLLFTDKFLVISDLMLLQMMGDFFRVIGWVVGIVVLAKAMVKIYILAELLQGLIFILLSLVELHYSMDLKGVISAYVITCLLYCLLALGFLTYKFRPRTIDLIIS